MAEHKFGHCLSLLGEGLEPSRPKAPEPKSGVSANFTTRAEKKALKYVCDLYGP